MDKDFRPIVTPQADYAKGPKLIYPSWTGGHDWQPMSYNPRTGLVHESPMLAVDLKSHRALGMERSRSLLVRRHAADERCQVQNFFRSTSPSHAFDAADKSAFFDFPATGTPSSSAPSPSSANRRGAVARSFRAPS